MAFALFLVGVLAGLAGLWGVIKGNTETKYGDSLPFRKIGAAVIPLGLLVIGLASIATVPSKNVACVTEFGSIQEGTLTHGWHLTAPWASTEDYKATLQTLKLSGESDDNGNPIQVRLANSTMADVDVTIQWRLDEHADISQLCQDYTTFDQLEQNVVRRNLSAALAQVFEKYDPLAALEGKAVDGISTLAEPVKERLTALLPTGIKVEGNVLLPKIKYADEVQKSLDKYNTSVADTKVAEQQKATAIARAQAAEQLAKGNLTSEILYQNCLDLTERLASAGHIWAGWSCGTPPGLILQAK